MTNDELFEEIKSKLIEAEADQSKSAMLAAQMIIHAKQLALIDVREITLKLGLKYSWHTEIRKNLKARFLMLEQGYEVTKEN